MSSEVKTVTGFNSSTELKRKLGLGAAIALGVGTTVGSGIFSSVGAASTITSIMAIIVIIGSLLSCIIFQPRIEYAMAKDGLFFKSFAKVHPKWETPYFSILVRVLLV